MADDKESSGTDERWEARLKAGEPILDSDAGSNKKAEGHADSEQKYSGYAATNNRTAIQELNLLSMMTEYTIIKLIK